MMKLPTCCFLGYIFTFLLRVISSETDTQGWTFTFPESISAMKNSDVTIPCKFTSPVDPSEVHLIWYKLQFRGYPQVFNSKDPSEVIESYKGRTLLGSNRTGDCTLKIKDVRETAKFFPGISKEFNSWDLNNSQHVEVKVTGCSEDSSCGSWRFTLPTSITALEGSCVDLPCSFAHPKNARDFNFFWYRKYNPVIQVFNMKTPSKVNPMYEGRTSLTGDMNSNCSLRIINVTTKDAGEFFPGVNTDINYYELQRRTITVIVSEKPEKPLMSSTIDLEEEKTVNITCSVEFTCIYEPPTLTWSMIGHQTTQEQKYQDKLGTWNMVSVMMYTTSYIDNGRMLECVATFPNNRTSKSKKTLKIEYSPKKITISVVEVQESTEGDNVTLRCSSQANPSEIQYTWFLIRQDSKLHQGVGDTITVKNVTNTQYICSATNKIGTRESLAFKFAGQSDNEDTDLYVLIGTVAGLVLITALAGLYCIITRVKRKTSVVNEMTNKNMEQSLAQEHIPMDDHLYGNIDHNQQYKDEAEQSITRLPNSSPIYDNTDVRQRGIISQSQEKQAEGAEYVFYTSIELPAPEAGLQQPRTLENTQYAVLQHM